MYNEELWLAVGLQLHTNSPMIVLQAVDLVLCVHSERHSIQTLITDGAAEAAWVVRLSQRLQDLRRNTMFTCCQTTHNQQWHILCMISLLSWLYERRWASVCEKTSLDFYVFKYYVLTFKLIIWFNELIVYQCYLIMTDIVIVSVNILNYIF